jgi:UDP-N-acetylmuramoylalanine--D-glutamate ligase
MKVAIIGGGVEGQAAAKYWLKQSAEVTVHDRADDITVPQGVKTVLGQDYLKGLSKYDLVVRSPGVKPRDIKTTAPVTSSVREFFQKCPARIIGVTGTKGKGTTSTLLARMLGEAGWKVWLGGNIGRSPLEFLDRVRANDLVVLELSSFQLMDLDISPYIAVCLMVAPEHMDWHKSMREYIAAKGNLFWHQRPTDIAIYNAHNDYSTQIATLSPGQKIPFLEKPGAHVADGQVVVEGEVICAIEEVGLVGPHNLENICAAVTAAHVLIPAGKTDAIRRAVRDFKGLEHRLELAGEIEGVRYYDDSFATTPETAIAAVASFAQPKVLILGGSEKKSKFGDLGKAVAAANVREVVLVGVTAPGIHAALAEAGFTKVRDGGNTMESIMKAAQAAARPGDVVLLSPACASFDMFKDYKDRGDQFKAAVRERSK